MDTERYTFIVEWLDPDSSLLRKFYLFFFPKDNTIELFDIKNRRTFLKRAKCEGVTLQDLHIGAAIKIFSRVMKVVSFGDGATQKQLAVLKQKTFGMLKPDVVKKSAGEVLKVICESGFKISKLRMAQLSKTQAETFYAEHKGKPFLAFLVDFISSGPIIGMELVANDAVKKWREFIGPTDSEVARKEAPNSLRAKYGKDKSYNAVHGSDSPESAERELNFLFPTNPSSAEQEIKNTATYKNCTCCIVKPHAVQAGLLGCILVDIEKKGYKVTAMQMFHLELVNVEEFYEVYRGVVPEYSGMVCELASGPCVVLEVVGPGEDTPQTFREFIGPADPDIARQLRPTTLRAKYGKTKIQNAVHCTDLPQDGVLEVEYFFKLLMC